MATHAEPATAPTKDFFRAPIEDVYPSPEQPRRQFDEALLEELAVSIRTHGIIQPLVVRARTDGGFFLIAGERRWRAAQKAALSEVPVVIHQVSPRDALERALVENIQRADLNPIEEAEAYSRLIAEHDYTQEQLAERVGKDRSTIANSLRLLKLPAGVRGLVEGKKLSMGHARALLSLDSDSAMETMARQIVAKQLSVRATEAAVRDGAVGSASKESRKKPPKSASVRDLENRLTKSLSAQVALSEDRRGKGGRIEIRYADLDDLDRLLDRLLR